MRTSKKQRWFLVYLYEIKKHFSLLGLEDPSVPDGAKEADKGISYSDSERALAALS